MAPFPEDPMSTLATLVRRKTKIRKTKHSSGSKLSKPVLIVIAVVVVVVLIAAVILSIVVWRRRRARARANKHSSMMPGYSNDSSGGLYNATPGYVAGHGAGAGAHQYPAGDHGGTGPIDYHVPGGAADQYLNYASQDAQGGGGYGQGYGTGPGNYASGMPQRPAMAFGSSSARV